MFAAITTLEGCFGPWLVFGARLLHRVDGNERRPGRRASDGDRLTELVETFVLPFGVFLAVVALCILSRSGLPSTTSSPRHAGLAAAWWVLTQGAKALGASGGGDVLYDGAFAFRVGGKSFQLFGAQRSRFYNVFVCLAARVGAQGASGSPFRGGERQAIEKLPCAVFRKSDSSTRWGRLLGLNFPIETGDPAFDEGVYVECESGANDLAAVLSDERVRRGVLALLEAGCFDVALADRGYSVVASWHNAQQLTGGAEALQAAALHVADVIDGLPLIRSAEVPRSPRFFGFETIYFLLGPGACVVAHLADRTWDLIRSPGWPAVVVTLVLTALLLGGVYTRVRRRADARMSLGLGVLGTAMLGPGAALLALLVANGWRDDTSVEYVASVAVEEIESSKGSRIYRKLYAVLPPRAPGGEATRIAMDYKLPEGLDAPRRAIVRVGRGRLGYEWLRSIELRFSTRHEADILKTPSFASAVRRLLARGVPGSAPAVRLE